MKDWGLSHRFAGSGDRAAIAGLVYDALRRKASSAWIMGADTPRAVLLGMLARERGLDSEAIAKLATARASRRSRSPTRSMRGCAPRASKARRRMCCGDYPEWLDAQLAATFGDERAEEGAALASRAPLDLRVNTLKATREEAAEALAEFDAAADALVAGRPAHRRGARCEEPGDPCRAGVPQRPDRDPGRGLAACRAARGAKPGEQVIDLCAGAGGKTLALAAAMENHGQIHATDTDKRRLAPIHERLERAGARNVQVHHAARRQGHARAIWTGQADLVLIDAPCTGTGAWRRNPDAKWRVRPGALAERLKDQAEALDHAAALVKPGGRIAYVTCSVLDDENGAQVRAFLARHRRLCDRAAGRGRKCARRARLPVPPRGADVGRGAADDAAPHRHRRIFRERVAGRIARAIRKHDVEILTPGDHRRRRQRHDRGRSRCRDGRSRVRAHPRRCLRRRRAALRASRPPTG